MCCSGPAKKFSTGTSHNRPLGSYWIPVDKLAGDDDALQFVGALADDEQRRVAIEALDGELLRIAVAAMDAHRFEADIDRRLGRKELGHPGLHVAALAFVIGARRVLDE